MAGKLMPLPGLIEASYTVNGYVFYSKYTHCPLFDGKITEWQGGGDAYWAVGNYCYLDITINSQCNIYRLSQRDYYAESHQQPFVIEKRKNDIWVDVTAKYPQTLEYRPVTWIKTISNLPKGRYRFTSPRRMDAEWFIEKAKNYRILYLKHNAIYGIETIA